MKKIIAMCALASAMAGCMTMNQETGKKEYTAVGKTWNTVNFGAKGMGHGTVMGAKAGYTFGGATNDFPVTDRIWNATKMTFVGMYEGTKMGVQQGFEMTPEKYEELKIEKAREQEMRWKQRREQLEAAQGR